MDYMDKDILKDILNSAVSIPNGQMSLSPKPQTNILTTPRPYEINQYFDAVKDPDYAEHPTMAAIVFPKDDLTNLERFLNTVDDATIIFDKEDIGFMFVAQKTNITNYINKYQSHDDSATKMENCPIPVFMVNNITNMRNDINEILADSHIRNQINLMYLLCSGNINGDKEYDGQSGFDQVVQQFVLNKISAIETLQTNEEKKAEIFKLANRFLISPAFWNAKIDQFNKTLGVLKFSTPLFMDVVLSDGSRANLFTLDKSKEYRIMHSMFVSKIKQKHDFSNLRIHGDFICDYAKTEIIFPSEINGVFSYCYCKHPITKVPQGAISANLSYTVRSFKDLNQIEFPESVLKVFVARSMINNAVKDTDEMEQIRIFSDKYPKITVLDNQCRMSLLEALEQQQQILQQKLQALEPVQKPINAAKKPVIEEKTDDWIQRKEIVELLSKDSRFNDVADLPKLIQRATNMNSALTEQKMCNGNAVICVHTDNIESVINTALEIMHADKAREKNKKKNNKDTDVETQKSPKEQKQELVITEQIEKIEIEKYIPKNIWKDICDSCKDSSQLLYSVLEKINQVNTDFTKQEKKGAVQYIDDNGQIQVLSSVCKKGGCALGQSINNGGQDKRRIVWTFNPGEQILVATAFFTAHSETHKIVAPYKTARTLAAKGQNTDGMPVTRDLVTKNNYLKVSDLLEQYKSNKIIEEPKNTTDTTPDTEPKPQQEKPAKQTAAKNTEQKTTQTVSVDKKSASKEKHTHTDTSNTDKTPVIAKTNVSEQQQNNDSTKSENSQKTENDKPTKTHRKRCQSLVDVKATQVTVDAMINRWNEDITQLAIELYQQQNNPYEQLNTLNMIKKLIIKKTKYMGK